MSTDTRLERSIEELEAANGELLAFLDTLTDEQWRTGRSKEGWPVCALGYHIADGYRLHLLWIEYLRRGQEVPGSPEELDQANARTAEDAAGFSLRTARRAVETGGRLLVAYLRGLRSEEIDRSAPHGPLGGKEVSVADMLEITPWHVREHLSSLRSCLAGSWSPDVASWWSGRLHGREGG
ncbi:MAG TPA: DinB family protein [Actinomycetota bacterium]|nr:DinB family protein [Actinomycetota bacterium]